MQSDNLQKLNNYFEEYIDRMLIKDIELLKVRNDELRFSYPYILLVCSCIDLFGGIEKDFTRAGGRGNSEERFIWFITEWMGRVNTLYKEKSLAYLIYDRWRCGIVHQATLKKGFEASSYMYPRDKHLHLIKDNERIFIHSLQFADDLIEAQKLYRKYINDNATNIIYIESLYSHLLNMTREDKNTKKQYLEQFIHLLQKNNLVFYSIENIYSPTETANVISTSTSTSPSHIAITRLPDEKLLPAIPSAAPEEDDIEEPKNEK